MRYLPGIIVSLTFISCGNYRYLPVTVKPAFFTGKGDMEVSINANSMGELHAAYALTDHFAISGTAAYGTHHDTVSTYDTLKNKTSQTVNGIRNHDNELAIGYFKSFEDHTTFEVFAGYAFQNQIKSVRFNNYADPSKNFNIRDNNLNYTRFFIQPSYGKRTKNADIGFVNRVTFFRYFPDNHSDMIWDSVLFMRFGFRNFKLMWQFGFTMSKAGNYYDYFPFNAGLGLYFQLNKNE